ncbi:MAG: hybrid sensor histidine kinase/response regulator [Proteobacteria bacterium]|nr:hybrid sensor histidine kinase/response regulator [Pseudomonadota bacterium]MBI3498808.1 hybrid sensor histidine kinase/response regulator [Pseudomonadota bacterium]
MSVPSVPLAGGNALSHRQARILVAAASEPLRRRVVAALAPDGFATVEATDNLDQLIEAVERHSPHVLLLDFGNGEARPPEHLAMLQRIAKLPGEKATRVVALAASQNVSVLTDVQHLLGDWIPYEAEVAVLAWRTRLNAELVVLRRHADSAGKAVAEAIRQRINKLEEGLVLLRAAHDRLADELKQAKARQRESAIMPASVLHELRTPLNAISGFADIMKQEMYGPLGHDKYRDYVSSIYDASQHLLEVANDLLDVYKLEAGQIPLEPKPFDPRRTIKSVADLLADQAQRAGVMLLAEAPNRVATIESDERRMRQILVNLVGNAIKFTPRGGRVVINAVDDVLEPLVKVSVSDSGPGLPESEVDRLLQPIGAEQAAGGLGLSITKLLVERLGGRFNVQSKVGAGTIATVTLPVQWPARV